MKPLLLRSLAVFSLSLLSSAAFAQVIKVDWILSVIEFDDIPSAEYTRLKVDIGVGERYFPASAVLLAQQANTPVFALTGTCFFATADSIKCSFSFERGTLTLELNSALSGTFYVADQTGTHTKSGQVSYTGIIQ